MGTSAEEVHMVTGQCDRCGAAARVGVRVKKTELVFCDHHYRMYSEKLKGYPVRATEDSIHFEPVPA